tara:strand:+ start:865 stop:1359 length:495 start_codon:yes stop_codon:yes gene_type:complete
MNYYFGQRGGSVYSSKGTVYGAGLRSTGAGSTGFGLKPKTLDTYQGKKIKIGPNGGKYIISNGKKRYVPHDYLGEKKQKHYSKDGKSNVSKYKKEKIPKDKFCGPSGGAAQGSYPVNTRKRCSAALSYARFAPNPCGIARCVNRKCPKDIGSSSALMKKCKVRK